MMFIYKITEEKIPLSFRENHITFPENAAAAYTLVLGLHRKLILTIILQKFSQTNFEIMYIQKIEK